MVFKKMSILGKSYGDDYLDCDDAAYREVTNFNMVDHELEGIIGNRARDREEYERVKNFLLHLAICHTVVTSKDPKDETKFILNSSSPDELSLLNGAKYYGIKFIERNAINQIVIQDKNDDQWSRYQLLNVIEFTSDRKRMTVIIKTPEGKIKALCKGADSVIIPLLAQSPRNDELRELTLEHLFDYAKDGLRTLMICEKEIDIDEYKKWSKSYENACSAIANRE